MQTPHRQAFPQLVIEPQTGCEVTPLRAAPTGGKSIHVLYLRKSIDTCIEKNYYDKVLV